MDLIKLGETIVLQHTTLHDIDFCAGYFIDYVNDIEMNDLPSTTSIETMIITYNHGWGTYTMTINNNFKANFNKDEINYILSKVSIKHITNVGDDVLFVFLTKLNTMKHNTGRFYSVHTFDYSSLIPYL